MGKIAWDVETELAYIWCRLRKEWSYEFEQSLTDIVLDGGWDRSELPPMCRAQIAYAIWTLLNR
jgi:hypothetical protein